MRILNSITYYGEEITKATYIASPGLYKIECWGAEGSREGKRIGGKGGFVSGFIKFERKTLIF